MEILLFNQYFTSPKESPDTIYAALPTHKFTIFDVIFKAKWSGF